MIISKPLFLNRGLIKIGCHHCHYLHHYPHNDDHFSPLADVFKRFIEVEELEQRPPAFQKKNFLKLESSFRWLPFEIALHLINHIYIEYPKLFSSTLFKIIK